MEPKLKTIWDNLLDQLEKNTLTQTYLAEKLEPYFNYLIFKTTDDLNNNLLNYALIYRNLVLLEFIFNKINFNSLENEVKEKITEDMFSIFVALTKSLKQNLGFLVRFLDLIKDKSFKEVGCIFVTQGPAKMKVLHRVGKEVEEPEISKEELADRKVMKLFLNLNLDEKYAFKLINPLIKFFVKDCGVDKSHPFIVKIKQIYDEKYTNLIWNQMNLKKLDSKPEFYVLKNIPYNILHEAVRLNRWHFFQDLSIFVIKDLLLTPDVAGKTPLHQCFHLADHLTISHIIKAGSQGGILTEEILKRPNAKGQNLIHLLIENKKLESHDLKQILLLLRSCVNLKNLLACPDKFSWIPLSYYFLVKLKRSSNFSEWIKTHLEIVDLLMPGSECLANYSEFSKEDFVLYLNFHHLLDPKLQSKNKQDKLPELLTRFSAFATNLTVFNNKFLELCFDRHSEDLLLFLLKKIPTLELNTFLNAFGSGLTQRTHALENLMRNNWLNAISQFFSRNSEKFFVDYRDCALFKYLEQEFGVFGKFIIESGVEIGNSYFHYGFSLMDEVISGLKSIKNEAHYSKLADLVFKKMSDVVGKLGNERRERILLNIGVRIAERTKKGDLLFKDSITIAELFDLDDNQMIELFENQIKSIKGENLTTQFKLFLMKILTRRNLTTFYESSSLQKFFCIDESAENELTQVFEQQQLGSPTIEGLLKELYFNPMCIPHVFSACPKLFLALWESGTMIAYSKLLLDKQEKITWKHRSVNLEFVEQFLSYSIEQYLSNSHFTDHQKGELFEFITKPKFLCHNLLSSDRIAKVFLKNAKIIEEFFDMFKKGSFNSAIIFQLKAIHSYLFSVSNDDKAKLVYFSIIDNYMQKLSFDEIFENSTDFAKNIGFLENMLTIEVHNPDFPDSGLRFQEYLKHGFLFKLSGPALLRKNMLVLKDNKDPNLFQKYLKYHLATGQGIMEFLLEDKSLEQAAIQIIHGSGRWQMFRLIKSENNYRSRRSRGKQDFITKTMLDVAAEHNCLGVMAALINNKTFMSYYETLPNKESIFFLRLNRIVHFVKSDMRDFIPIKIERDPKKEDFATSLRRKIFGDPKENPLNGFSKQISMLLGYFSEEIDKKSTVMKEVFATKNRAQLKDLSIEHPLILRYYNYSAILEDYNNFILRALPFLDYETFKQIPLSCFSLLLLEPLVFQSLLRYCIIFQLPSHASLLKDIFLNYLQSTDISFFLKKKWLEYLKISALIIGDCSIFFEVIKKLTPNLSEKTGSYVTFHMCLRTLYYQEGRGFREFLKWAFVNKISLDLNGFKNYISTKPLMRANWLALFMYMKVGNVPFSLFCNDAVFNEFLSENQKEMNEILQEQPERFFELGILKQICSNSLANKLLSLLKTLDLSQAAPDVQAIYQKKLFEGFLDISFFDYVARLYQVGFSGCCCRKIFNGLQETSYYWRSLLGENEYKKTDIRFPKTFEFSIHNQRELQEDLGKILKAKKARKSIVMSKRQQIRNPEIDPKEIDQALSKLLEAQKTSNKFLKDPKTLQRDLTSKKRLEFSNQAQQSGLFESNRFCCFSSYSEEDIQNCSHFGLQDPSAALEALIDYFLFPKLEGLSISPEVLEEAELWARHLGTLQPELFGKITSLLKKRGFEERVTTLALEVVVLSLKLNTARLIHLKPRIRQRIIFKEEIEAKIQGIIKKYLPSGTKIEPRARPLLVYAVQLMMEQGMYSSLLKLWKSLQETFDQEIIKELGFTHDFLKACVPQLIIENNLTLFKEYLSEIPNEIQIFYSVSFTPIPEDSQLPTPVLKIPLQTISLIESPNQSFPLRCFNPSRSEFFMELHKREFQFESLIQTYVSGAPSLRRLRAQLPKDKTHFSLLEFATLRGFTKLFEYILETMSATADIEINFLVMLLIEKGSFPVFQKMMQALYQDDQVQVLEFVLNNDLIMRLAGLGHEEFLIRVFKDYIIPQGNKKIIPENKLILLSNKKDQTVKGTNIFHHIANHRMAGFMYLFLDYLLIYKFESDSKKMKYFLEEFLLMKTEDSEAGQRTPIYYALKNKFFELMSLCELNDIVLATNEQKSTILLDTGVKQAGLAYFSRFYVADPLVHKIIRVEKGSFFHERYLSAVSLFSRLKPLLSPSQLLALHPPKPKISKLKAKSSPPPKSKPKRPKGPKLASLELFYLLEALLFGRKILELDQELMKQVRTLILKTKEPALVLLFLELGFPTADPKGPNLLEDLLMTRHEAFIFYLLDKGFSNTKKPHDDVFAPLESAKRLCIKGEAKDMFAQILTNSEIQTLIKAVQQKLRNPTDLVAKEPVSTVKLDNTKSGKLMVFSHQCGFKHLLCYLMNLFPGDFLLAVGSAQKDSQDSFFLSSVAFDWQLTYRLLKVLEKSNVFLMLEKEFQVYLDRFLHFDAEEQNLRLFTESFKVLVLLLSEEGYFSHAILQATETQKAEEALEALMTELANRLKDWRMVRGHLMALANEVITCDLEQVVQWGCFPKGNNRPENIWSWFSLVFQMIAKNPAPAIKNYSLDRESNDSFVNGVLEGKLKKEIDSRHVGLFLCWAFSFYITNEEGYGIYEEVAREFPKETFVWIFDKERKGFSVEKEEDGRFKIYLYPEVEFDHKRTGLQWKFDNMAYNELKQRLHELTFERAQNEAFDDFKKAAETKLNSLISNLQMLAPTIYFELHTFSSLSISQKQVILDKIIKNSPSKKCMKNPALEMRHNAHLGLFNLLEALANFADQEKKVKLFKITDMFAPHNTQNITQNSAFGAFNISQRLEGEISYLLEQQPDATYQVKYRAAEGKGGHKPDEVVFSEYYELQYPSGAIRLVYQDPKLFNAQLDLETFFGYVMRVYDTYNRFTQSQIKNIKGELNDMDELHMTWQFTFDSKGQILVNKDIFPLFLVLKMRGVFEDFQNQVRIRLEGPNITPFKLNVISFLDVFVAHVIDCTKKAKESSKEIFFGKNHGNLFNIINVLWENSLLKGMIFKIISKMAEEQGEVMKVIRGIYVQFKEKDQADLHEKEHLDDCYLKGLDRLFRFTKTQYYIHKYMLVIEFGVVKTHDSLDELTTIEFKENPRIINDYFYMIGNKFEFFESLFNNEQTINNVLNRFQLENTMFELSKKLSTQNSKVMTVSINFDSLFNVLKKEFYEIKGLYNDRYEKILRYEQLWKLIISIKEFFLTRAEQILLEETKDPNFDDAFHILYLQMMSAFSDQRGLSEILMRNFRIYSLANSVDKDFRNLCTSNALQLLQIPLRSKNEDNLLNENLFKLSFLFQIDIGSFMIDSKVGEVYLIGLRKEKKHKTKVIEITNKKNGILKVLNLRRCQYQDARYLLNDRRGGDGKPFKEIENLVFVFLVTKKWPEMNYATTKFKNIGITDSNMRAIFLHQSHLQKLCKDILSLDNDHYDHSLFPQLFYRNPNTVKSELSVSNLIQFQPSLINFDFELFKETKGSQHELPALLLPQSLSFNRAQSLMQSLNRSLNTRTIRVGLNLDASEVKQQETPKETFNLASRLDINLIYQFQINSFLRKMTLLLERVNFAKHLPELGLNLRLELDREIDSRASEFEEHILLVLDVILDIMLDVFESFFKLGNLRDPHLFDVLTGMNYEFDNEHNPLNFLIAAFVFKDLRELCIRFELNSSSAEMFHYSPENKTLTLIVKITENPSKIAEKTTEFLNSDEIFTSFSTLLLKKELNFISDCFSLNPKNLPPPPDILYETKKVRFSNANLTPLLHGLYEFKFFKKIEFINKLKNEDLEKERERLLVCLVLFEFVVYQSLISFKVISLFNKAILTGNMALKFVLDQKLVVEPSTKDTLFLGLGLEGMGFLRLVMNNYNAIEGLLGQPVTDIPLDCIISFKDSIIPLKKEVALIKIRQLYKEDINSYMARAKIPPRNAKLRSILINSATCECHISLSASIDDDSRVFELSFERNSTLRPQRYFLKTYINSFLVHESQILLIKQGVEAPFYPMISSLWSQGGIMEIGQKACFLVNNTLIENEEETKESLDTPKRLQARKKQFAKNFQENLDFRIDFKLKKQGAKLKSSLFSDGLHCKLWKPDGQIVQKRDRRKLMEKTKEVLIPNQYPRRKGMKTKKNMKKRSWWMVKTASGKKSKKGIIKKDLKLISRWLNPSVLMVQFWSDVVAQVSFSFTENVEEPRVMVYKLKDEEVLFEKRHPLIFQIETKRTIFYPYTQIYQVQFEENPVIPIKLQDEIFEEEKKEAEAGFPDNLHSQKLNLIPFMHKMNPTGFKQFFHSRLDDVVPLDFSPENNEKDMIEKEEIKSIMMYNTLNMVKASTTEQKLYSLAGQVRKEFVKFYDLDHNEISFLDKEPPKVVFRHTSHNEILFKGTITISPDKSFAEVRWCPLIKGLYKVFFNGVLAKNYEICVLSNQVHRPNCKVDIPEIKAVGFFDNFTIQLEYRDQFGNIFGELEKKLLNPKQNPARFLCKTVKKSTFKPVFRDVDLHGKQRADICFELKGQMELAEAEEHTLQLLINDELEKEFHLRVDGYSFEKRMEKLYSELRQKFPMHGSHHINTKRMYFVEDLKNLEKEKLGKTLSVNFEGEGGIDAGGLKREYYDLVGATMKNPAYSFFVQNPKTLKYTINPELYKNPEGQIYLQVFGKLLANSILEREMVGVSLAPSLLKLIFDQPLVFADLYDEFDDITIKNYEQMRGMSADDFSALELTFTVFSQGKVVDLIENGSNISVVPSNVEEYLTAITKYNVETRKLKEVNAFKKGFCEVLDPKFLLTYLQPAEISSLTSGETKITPDNVIALTNFSGGNAVMIGFFKRYLMETTQEALEGFVKFSTGSRSLPYNTKNTSKINVSFNRTDIKKLPIAHTCSKAIEVPCYPTFEEMKKKLDVAFLYGAEGFAFG